jgi:hypothetical protein
MSLGFKRARFRSTLGIFFEFCFLFLVASPSAITKGTYFWFLVGHILSESLVNRIFISLNIYDLRDPSIVEKIRPKGVYCIERNITIFLISRFTIQIGLSLKGLCHEMNIFLKAYLSVNVLIVLQYFVKYRT